MAEQIKNAFVCGHPISHSRSPMIHNHWLKAYGIDGTYRAIDVPPADFETFIHDLKANNLTGGNVTIPYKEAAYRLAQKPDEICKLLGAANTLWFEDGVLNATNTDAHGFAANLDHQAPGWDKAKSALVLGAGGASRAVIHALIQRGFTSIMVANRTLERATELKDRFGSSLSAHGLDAAQELASEAHVIINTTSLGMKGEGSLPLDMTKLKKETLVTDIVYVPLMTPLLIAAKDAGLKVFDGLGMLLHQAAPGFEKWFGVLPTVTEALRTLIIEDMTAKMVVKS
ncbi:MAG: shikimate dehydrogenase [Rhizobiaceae bacterium]